jgi:hypothetical protein
VRRRCFAPLLRWSFFLPLQDVRSGRL